MIKDKNVSGCLFPSQRIKLLQMVEDDQKIRLTGDFELPITELQMFRMDHINQNKLSKIMDIIKYPTIANVSHDGSEAIWLIAQHAIYNLELQKEILRLFTESYRIDKDSVYKRGIPYLTDRIRISEGFSQKYGTQIWSSSAKSKPQLYPIIKLLDVDKLRETYGLDTLQNYKQNMNL